MIIQLMNGQSADTADIKFDSKSYHFTWDTGSGVVDVTDVMTRAQKQFWPNFDPISDNYRLSNQRITSQGGSVTVATPTGSQTIPGSALPIGPVGDTSYWSNFWTGVQSDLPSIPSVGKSLAIGVGAVVALMFFLRH